MENLKKSIKQLAESHTIDQQALKQLLKAIEQPNSRVYLMPYLMKKARAEADAVFGRDIYVRGLIEFTNYCIKNCTYCGIRKDNAKVHRYRMSKEEILRICDEAYQQSFRTFVLQGGEDGYYFGDNMVEVVQAIKDKYPDCAVTLSIGERDETEYRALKQAGADRFLLRHETIHRDQYEKFHPGMSYDNRLDCIQRLKRVGYQTGTGFLVGLPNQTVEQYVNDLLFIKQLNPEMVGMGPYITHEDTPLANNPNGDVEITLCLLAIVRLLLPNVLLPSTTALNTLSPDGFISGFNAGANVIMLNLTPDHYRKDYALYQGKVHTDVKTKQALDVLNKRIQIHGYTLNMCKGDYKNDNK